jgi:hypothetical protein
VVYSTIVYNCIETEELRNVWQSIPEKVDVLITHAPPKGFQDANGFV